MKVMTESPLFTVRNPHFITLMNENGCACTPRAWQDKRRKKMRLSLPCVIVKAREVLRLFGATAGYMMRKSVFAYVFLRL